MKHISRRAFLGGAGALVALPFLPSAGMSAARAAAAAQPKLVVYYFPCGRNPATWIPSATGSQFALPQSFASFTDLKADMLFISGLSVQASIDSQGIGDHARATGTLLTGKPVLNGNVFQAGVSADQAIARSLPPTTRFSSLQWTSGQPTVCDLGCLCTYTQCISWADERTPLAPLSDPLSAYNQLFSGNDPTATAAQQAARNQGLKSVLDYVLGESKSFVSKLNTSDQSKMDEYFTGIRSLETSLFQPASANCDPGTAPQPGPDYQTSVRAFNDMMVMALQCDLTRVITYMIEFDISYRAHPWINAPLGHHAITHTGGDDAYRQLVAVETWEAEQLAYFVRKLKATNDANGASLLDSTAVVATSSMGLGASHDHGHVAPVIIGKAGGAFAPGRHVDFANNQPYNNLLISLQGAFGMNAPNFGMDGVGPLPNMR